MTGIDRVFAGTNGNEGCPTSILSGVYDAAAPDTVRWDPEPERIEDPDRATAPPLVSTRTLVPSPFESERGRVLYAGGFDANHQEAHDTAWLYRGEIAPR